MTSERPARGRQLDDGVLAAVLARAPSLPEPLAALALEIEIAQDEGDQSGIRMRLYELGIGVVRYGLSFGLAALASAGGTSAPEPLADALRRAFKLTDGRWFELVRMLESSLKRPMPLAAKCLKFGASSVGNALVASRNAFIHDGGTGDDAPERTLAVLDAAADLLALPLRVVVSCEPPLFEIRHGVPKRRDVWKKTDAEPTVALEPGQALVLVGGSFVRIDPWLPLVDKALRLVDSPHAPGRSWRCIFPETGEHVEQPELDRAVQGFVGDDGRAPRPPTEKPRLIGRSTERTLVERTLREASEGRVRVLVVTGPQGAGLSRILAETASAAGAFGFPSVVEAFGSIDRRTPFSALRLALHARAGDTEDLRAAIERIASEVSIGDRARLDAEIEAVEERLVERSRESPLLLVIDDAQWLDDQTIALLRLLTDRANRGAAGRLAILVAIRKEPSASAGLEQFLLQVDKDVGSGATRVPIEHLDPKDARALIQSVAPISTEVTERLLHGASGLPFYIVQPLLVWIESGALEWTHGTWDRIVRDGVDPISKGVPGIAELVDARVRSFFDSGSEADHIAHYVLACLSSDGAPTPRKRLFRVLGRVGADEILAERVLETLRDAAIVIERERIGFAIPQPIVAEALFDRYRGRSWWAKVFAALLAVLEEEPEAQRDAEKLARGYDLLGEANLALHWYRAAVAQRMRHGAFDEARVLAELVVTRESSDEGRLRAELLCVEAMERNGAATAARERHRGIYVAGDPKLELEWRVVGEELAVAAGNPPGPRLDALVADADAQSEPRLQVMSRMIVARRSRSTTGRGLIREALAILEQNDLPAMADARYRLLALDVELAYELREGGLEDLRATANHARAAARQLGSTWAELDVENDVAILESDLGDNAGAIIRLNHVSARAAEAHFGSLRRLALTNAAALEIRTGRIEDARGHAAIAEAEARAAGDSRFLAVALSILSETELLRDEPRAALRAITECIELRERAGEKNVTVALLRRAEARSRLDDETGARADADLALSRAKEAQNVDHTALARLWIGVHEMKRASVGAHAALRAVIDALAPIEHLLRAPTRRKLDEARVLVDADA